MKRIGGIRSAGAANIALIVGALIIFSAAGLWILSGEQSAALPSWSDGRFAQRFSRQKCGSLTLEKDKIGSSYGGWITCTEGLGSNSIVYGFGVGTDSTWDRTLATKYGVQMHAFDPTPLSLMTSVDNVAKSVEGASLLKLIGVGLTTQSSASLLHTFRLPTNTKHVSASAVEGANEKNLKGAVLTVPLMSLLSIMKELGHDHVDVLKMDIEGSEFDVLIEMARMGFLPTNQILVEFHERFFPNEPATGPRRVATVQKELSQHGFEMVFLASNKEEAVFMRYSD